MGAGKSFLGVQAALKLGLHFTDLDELIEEKTGMSVAQVFEKKGEEFFRHREGIILKNVPDNSIIATGGGIVEKLENRNYLKDTSDLVIWLHPLWDKVFERIRLTNRPLVEKLNAEELYNLWRRREEFYRECSDAVYYEDSVEGLIDLIKQQAGWKRR